MVFSVFYILWHFPVLAHNNLRKRDDGFTWSQIPDFVHSCGVLSCVLFAIKTNHVTLDVRKKKDSMSESFYGWIVQSLTDGNTVRWCLKLHYQLYRYQNVYNLCLYGKFNLICLDYVSLYSVNIYCLTEKEIQRNIFGFRQSWDCPVGVCRAECNLLSGWGWTVFNFCYSKHHVGLLNPQIANWYFE